MTMKSKITTILTATALAVACSAWLGCSTQKIRWEHDDTRAAIKKHEEQVKSAEAFNKTNTNPMMVGYAGWLGFEWRPQKGEIELGYRADGVVVWRPLPEAP